MSAGELLEQIAAIWVDRWLAHGGGLIVDPSGDHVQIHMRLDNWRRKLPERPEAWRRLNCKTHNIWNVGRWRELSELSQIVPGLREAIIHHVAVHGAKQSDGTRSMSRPFQAEAAAEPRVTGNGDVGVPV